MSDHKNHAAKFAFYYILALVALVFVAFSMGMVIFQIINKEIIDVINEYSGRYNDEPMRFAISAIVIASPIFFISMKQIYKSLYHGDLDSESGVRKWLTYLILLVSVLVMLGWLIATLNSFLGGELSSKFILKAITALGISGAVFGFFFYDIRRNKIKGHRDRVIKYYFWSALALVVVIFVIGIFTMDSPAEVRKQKIDRQITNDFNIIDGALFRYYEENEKLPENLSELLDDDIYLDTKSMRDPVTDQAYDYRVIDGRQYELCATFLSDNEDRDDNRKYYIDKAWNHEVGYQCLKNKVEQINKLRPI